MQEINFLESLHTSTKRDYIERACLPDRAECMRIASQYGKDYWDGDRKYGYGGYRYDGRWRSIAKKLLSHYELNGEDRILDVGCGKGHLLYEFGIMNDGIIRRGIDISKYPLDNCYAELRLRFDKSNCTSLPWPNSVYDFVYSINVLHNLNFTDLKLAIREIARVMIDKAWICVESFRNEEEKCNLLNWALTCQSYYSPDDWKNILTDYGYKGDVGFVFFE